MKKIKLFGMLFILMVGMFSIQSCKKTEDEPQLLSEFVLGSWDSQEVSFKAEPTSVYYHIDIQADYYILSLTDGEESMTFPSAGYTLDNEASTISIETPDMDQKSTAPEVEIEVFNVTWTEGGTTMTWEPIEGSDAPTLQWTSVNDEGK